MNLVQGEINLRFNHSSSSVTDRDEGEAGDSAREHSLSEFRDHFLRQYAFGDRWLKAARRLVANALARRSSSGPAVCRDRCRLSRRVGGGEATRMSIARDWTNRTNEINEHRFFCGKGDGFVAPQSGFASIDATVSFNTPTPVLSRHSVERTGRKSLCIAV